MSSAEDPTSPRTGEVRSSVAPARSDPRDALLEQLSQIAADKPIVLLVDDFDSSPQELREALREVGQLGTSLPVSVVAFSKEELQDGADAVMPEDAGATESRELRGLDQASLEKLLVSILHGTRPPQRLLQGVIEETGGNPLLVEELVLALFETGQLRHDRGRWTLTDPEGGALTASGRLPDLPVHAMTATARRARELPTAARRILSVLAVSSRPVPPDALTVAVRLGDTEFLDGLDVLVRRRLAEERYGHGIDLRHDMLRTLLRSHMSETHVRRCRQRLEDAVARGS